MRFETGWMADGARHNSSDERALVYHSASGTMRGMNLNTALWYANIAVTVVTYAWIVRKDRRSIIFKSQAVATLFAIAVPLAYYAPTWLVNGPSYAVLRFAADPITSALDVIVMAWIAYSTRWFENATPVHLIAELLLFINLRLSGEAYWSVPLLSWPEPHIACAKTAANCACCIALAMIAKEQPALEAI